MANMTCQYMLVKIVVKITNLIDEFDRAGDRFYNMSSIYFKLIFSSPIFMILHE